MAFILALERLGLRYSPTLDVVEIAVPKLIGYFCRKEPISADNFLSRSDWVAIDNLIHPIFLMQPLYPPLNFAHYLSTDICAVVQILTPIGYRSMFLRNTSGC
ncbi:hypothetical protein [Leptothoe kymatousa]|uniref:Uncharacterized protein n=1 Tax=Leptothoe kymatousa TAU-MAC 1615 TaxID=2364775 RepID=A0ABS5Y2Z1_9CYAN|nr:hypothetical protein [Leptothoe kymatousa]MBT9312199.1 hypothetical protein [Leptothoe kymatousa TAU-MAC 1615]